MIRKSILATLVAFSLSGGAALASGGEGHVEDFSFSFEGIFGVYDKAQLRRGLQVYQEVCAGCHGLRQVAFRTLGDPGGPELSTAEIKELAANYEVADTSDDAEPGDTRAATPADKFPAVTAAGAPDLSLMAKARAGFHGPGGLGINQLLKGMGGAEYIASILIEFSGEEKEMAGATLYENAAFTGGWMSMPPPLEDELVEYPDGSPNDVHAMAKDVSAFLMWTAEPKLVARKKTGFLVVLVTALLTVLLYYSNKQLWSKPKRKA